MIERAQAAFAEGRLQEADDLARRVFTEDPANIDALFLLGNLAVRAREPEVALKIFHRVLSLSPDHFDALNWMGTLMCQLGRPAEAAPYCKRAIELRPDRVEGHNNLGLCHLGSGHLDDAAASFERAVALRPDIAQVQRNFAVSLQRLGRDADAIKHYRLAIALEPQDAESRIALAELLIRARDYRAATSVAKEAVKIAPRSARARLVLAQTLTASQHEDEGEVQIREALALDPNMAAAHQVLGFRLQALGDFEGARESLRRSVQLDRRQGGAYYGLVQGRVTEDERDVVEKMELVLRTDELPPQDRAFVEYALGKAYGDLGRYDDSMAHYDQANRLCKPMLDAMRPFDRDAYRAGAEAMTRRFTSEFVDRHYGKGSDSVRPIFVLGMMRSGTTLVEQIVSSHPDVAPGGELRYWLSQSYSALGDSRPTQIESALSRLAEGYLKELDRVNRDASHVTDKMPQNYQLLGLIRMTFPNAKVIHVRRDPVDTGLSIYTTPYAIPPDYAHDQSNIVFAHLEYQRVMTHWRAVLPPDSFLEIDYEDLVADSEGMTRRIVAYCDLDWDDACLHPERNVRAVSTPSLWQVRQPIYRSSVGRWRRYEPWLGELRNLAKS